MLERIPLCANPELRNSEGRTYANSTPAVSRFACDPLGENPQPMANRFAAYRIDMEGRVAPSKPSQTNVSRWSVSRNLAPTSRPMPHAGGRSDDGVLVSGASCRRTCRCQHEPGLLVANRREQSTSCRPPRGWAGCGVFSASPVLRGAAHPFDGAVFPPPTPALWGAGLRGKDG